MLAILNDLEYVIIDSRNGRNRRNRMLNFSYARYRLLQDGACSSVRNYEVTFVHWIAL